MKSIFIRERGKRLEAFDQRGDEPDCFLTVIPVSIPSAACVLEVGVEGPLDEKSDENLPGRIPLIIRIAPENQLPDAAFWSGLRRR